MDVYIGLSGPTMSVNNIPESIDVTWKDSCKRLTSQSSDLATLAPPRQHTVTWLGRLLLYTNASSSAETRPRGDAFISLPLPPIHNPHTQVLVRTNRYSSYDDTRKLP
jgi:hypothetical protein